MADIEKDIEWMKEQISDIGQDTDRIMEGTHMTENIDYGAIASMLNNKGVDPSVLAMLDRGKEEGWGGGYLIVLFLILMLGFGGSGFGLGRNNGPATATENTVINEANYSRLLDAISTQGVQQQSAINDLATALGCNNNTVMSALAGLDKQLALNNGSITSAIQSCCCNVRSDIASSQNAIQTAIAGIGSQMQQCCCQTNLSIERGNNDIIQAIQAQTVAMNERFCDLEKRELKSQIDSLRDKVAEQSQTAQTAQILAAVNANRGITSSGTLDTSAGTWSGTGVLS